MTDKNKQITKILIAAALVIALIFIIYIYIVKPIGIIRDKVMNNSKADESATTTQNVVLNTQSKQNTTGLSIKLTPDQREFGNITTNTFIVYNKATGEECKLSDGTLLTDEVIKEITRFLDDNKYKTLSIGVVDNKFYIQQDKSVEEKSIQNVKIVTVDSSFSADNWFALTEATYNSTYIQADSLYAYNNGSEIKQYIYIYIDKNDMNATIDDAIESVEPTEAIDPNNTEETNEEQSANAADITNNTP